jgi:hypothetical protein
LPTDRTTRTRVVDQDVDVADLLGQPQRFLRFAEVGTDEPR